jgi:hypothetical protein
MRTTAPAEAEKKYRLQIDFGEEGYQELEALQHALGAPSKSEVIRDALGVLRWAAEEVRDDNRILVEKRRKAGKNEMKEIVFHFIKKRPRAERTHAAPTARKKAVTAKA